MKPPTTAELRELTATQRLELLEAVWDTLADDPASLPLSTEHRRELDRRLDDLKQSPDAGVRWSDLRRDLETGS